MARGPVWVIFGAKLLQFTDRTVQNGSPVEIGAFIERTTGVVSDQALLFAGISSVYTIGTIVGCCVAVWLLSGDAGTPQHVLIFRGNALWTAGILLSGCAYSLPSVGSSFAFFIGARAVAGLGAGCVSVTWPPYIESLVASGGRSMAMTLIEAGTALGSAIGFFYSAVTTEALGWGMAYVLLGLTALVLVTVPAFSLPSAARSPEETGVDSQGMPTRLASASATAAAAATATATAAATTAAASAASSPFAQFLAPAFVVTAVGSTAVNGMFIALQTFFPAIGVLTGLWADEKQAGALFGGAIVLGALLGSPAHGWAAEMLTARFASARSASASVPASLPASASPASKAASAGLAAKRQHPQHRTTIDTPYQHPNGTAEGKGGRILEATILLAIVALTTGVGFIISLGMDVALITHDRLLANVAMVLVGAFLLGSIGLRVRIPMLLSTVPMQPYAVLISTLAGYVGEFSGPLGSGPRHC
jgi:hypothetical protein